MALINRNVKTRKIKGNIKKAVYLKYDRFVGIEFELFPGNSTVLAKHLPRPCGIASDVSIGRGREVITPPTSADKLEKQIEKLCDLFKETNCTTDDRCGLHINLDGKDLLKDKANAIRLTNVYFTIDSIIRDILPPYRKRSRFCTSIANTITPSDYRQLLRNNKNKDEYYLHKKFYKYASKTYQPYRNTYTKTPDSIFIDVFKKSIKNRKRNGHVIRHGFNLHALLSLGRLELRYHAGTINKDKTLNWIWLNLHIVDWVVNNYGRSKIEAIRLEKDSILKRQLFYTTFDLPEILRVYMEYRAKICEFGSGYEEEDDDISFTNEAIEKELELINKITVLTSNNNISQNK